MSMQRRDRLVAVAGASLLALAADPAAAGPAGPAGAQVACRALE
jgi:hypothetical protein